MRKIKLVAFCDSPTGTLGLVIEGQQHNDDMFAATSGALIAHDIVEHPDTHSIGSVESELMALGALWECRGRWGDMDREGMGSLFTPEENMASDYLETFRYFVGRDEGYITAPKQTRASDVTCSFDEALKEMLSIFKKNLQREDFDFTSDQLKTFNSAALHYGRIGLRRYLSRWGDSLFGNAVFWNIADAVDGAIKVVEFEGQEFELTIDTHSCRAWCHECDYDEEY